MPKRPAFVSLEARVPCSQNLLLPLPPPQRPKYSQLLWQVSTPQAMLAKSVNGADAVVHRLGHPVVHLAALGLDPDLFKNVNPKAFVAGICFLI